MNKKQKIEYEKCKKDPYYFFEKYYLIPHSKNKNYQSEESYFPKTVLKGILKEGKWDKIKEIED